MKRFRSLDQGYHFNRLQDWQRIRLTVISDRVIYPPPPKKKTAAGGNKREVSNTIMSTLFALVFWSNKVIDVDIMLSITLAVS